MDPKGDRLRKIKMGQLKLPDSVLQSNNISLTADLPKVGGGCLEGGPRPRPVVALKSELKNTVPIIIPSSNSNHKKGASSSVMIPPNMADIPLPSNADIPLPKDMDIPLPPNDIIPLPVGDPLPKHEDIPLPSDASIPLPAEKPPQQERRKIRVHLEPNGDELLCRSCQMRFAKQIEYDTHLQSEEHQQAIKADLQEGRSHGTALPLSRNDKISPSHEKQGPVSFCFKKNIGARITNTQPFHRREEKPDSKSPGEVKLLKMESDDGMDKTSGTESSSGAGSLNREKIEGSEKGSGEVGKESKLLCQFVKVQCKDESERMLDWPKEMIQYTKTEPRIMFSCNPLAFDFSQLFTNKTKKSPARAEVGKGSTEDSGKKNEESKAEEKVGEGEKDENAEKKEGESEKKKSHKKKKKHRKHKKHKDKGDEKEEEDKKVEGTTESEEPSTKKKKKKKHKKKNDDAEKDGDQKDVTDNNGEKDKKKHKKSKKKRKHSEDEENEAGDDEKKKKRKKKKSKRKKKKHHHSESENEKSNVETGEKKEIKKEDSESADESDAEKEKDGKKKRKKKKRHHKKKEENIESSDSEAEKPDIKTDLPGLSAHTVGKKKFPGADSDDNTEKKYVARLQAISRSKTAVNPVASNAAILNKIKKEPMEVPEKKTPSERKRVNSESGISDTTPAAAKKLRVTPKGTSGVKDSIPVATIAPVTNFNNKDDNTEDSWSKIETLTNDNVKSKWDTSESDMDNALDDSLKLRKQKVLKKRNLLQGPMNKPLVKKDLKSPTSKVGAKVDTDPKKAMNTASSQRSTKSNISAGSAKRLSISSDMYPKARKMSLSPTSSHSSRSRSRSRSHSRSYSRSSSRSRSRSYSSSSYYSDRGSRRSGRHRRSRRSSSRSYSRSSSRSWSRSRHRRRKRSSSYSDYSRSRSYSSSRSRSRSRRGRRRSYSRSRSRSYSSSSYSSRSRSRSRSRRRRRRKRRRSKTRERTVSLVEAEKNSTAATAASAAATKKVVKEEKTDTKVDPSDIPLPDLSGKKEDEMSEEKLAKLKEKKPRTDVGKTVAKLVESLPENIPLPFSESVTKTVSSDSLPTGPPSEAAKEGDTGFIGPRLPNMAPPPPPPPGHMGHPRFPPNHGPPGPPRPGYWEHWDGPGHWDSPGPWDGPGPRPYRGMRPPFDPRMRGPYDPRMRGPLPPYMNRPRGPHPYSMGPRYQGGPNNMHGPPHPDYMDYDGSQYPSTTSTTNTSSTSTTATAQEEPPKKESPPPLPPPKAPSPKPPPPTKTKEPEQNPDIVIPPEQAEQYKQLQKQAAKHARRQIRRQQKKALGEPDEDSTSSEEEPEEQMVVAQQVEEEATVVEDIQAQQLVAVPQQLILAQPQPASSPSGYVVAVSGGQQILLQKQPTMIQAGMPIQAGQPMMAVPQSAIYASAAAAAAGAQPAHIVHQVPVSHPGIMVAGHSAGIQLGLTSQAASLQQLHHAHQIQQLQQIQHAQQAQAIQAQAIQAHNQAVAMAQAQAQAQAQHATPIIIGNQILVPRIGVRPAM